MVFLIEKIDGDLQDIYTEMTLRYARTYTGVDRDLVDSAKVSFACYRKPSIHTSFLRLIQAMIDRSLC